MTPRDIRDELAAQGRSHYARGLTDDQLQALLGVVGEVGLAADAVCLFPRPAWVAELVGDLTLDFELKHAEDRASISEWGHAG